MLPRATPSTARSRQAEPEKWRGLVAGRVRVFQVPYVTPTTIRISRTAWMTRRMGNPSRNCHLLGGSSWAVSPGSACCDILGLSLRIHLLIREELRVGDRPPAAPYSRSGLAALQGVGQAELLLEDGVRACRCGVGGCIRRQIHADVHGELRLAVTGVDAGQGAGEPLIVLDRQQGVPEPGPGDGERT